MLLCGAGCCLFACGPTGVSGAGGLPRRAGLLGVPVGGGPPARRPRRELRSARRLEARPGPAAAHGHRSQALRSLRRPSHQWGRVADRRLGASARCPARPCHPRAPQLGPPVPSSPFTPAGVLRVRPVRCLEAELWLLISNFARNSSMAHSNIEFASLELQRFWGVSKNDRVKLRAKCG